MRLQSPVERPRPKLVVGGIDYSGVTCEVVEITPELAKDWLQYVGPHQRREMESSIRKYAYAMLHDQFTMPESMIIFDVDGWLVNGQNRLRSCLRSGKSFACIVVKNMPPECAKNMDQGATRRIYQNMQVIGVGVATKELQALIRATAAGFRRTGHGVAETTDAYCEFLEQHREPLSFVLDMKKPKIVRRAPLMAAVVRAWYHSDETRLARFIDVVGGSPFEEPESAASMLGRQLESYAKSRDHMYLFGIGQSALAAFLKGEVRKLIRPVLDRNLFLLPGETD